MLTIAMCLVMLLCGSIDDDGRVVMVWPASAELDVTHYHVYRMERVGTVIAPRFVDYNTQHGRDYWYAATVVDEAGHESELSPMSEVVEVRVGTPPPQLRFIETASGGVRLEVVE